MWVKLLVIKHLDERGKQITYHPGDWVNVPPTYGRLWIAQGDAQVPGQDPFPELRADGIGAIILGKSEVAQKLLAPYKIQFEEGEPELRWDKTLWIDGNVPARQELLPVGFNLLDKWEVCAPLYSYDVLAANIGNEDEKEATKAIIRDLRVPLYDTRLVFVKKCDNTKYLLEQYMGYKAQGVNELHAFLRALYQAKPFVLALPATWNSKDAHP